MGRLGHRHHRSASGAEEGLKTLEAESCRQAQRLRGDGDAWRAESAHDFNNILGSRPGATVENGRLRATATDGRPAKRRRPPQKRSWFAGGAAGPRAPSVRSRGWPSAAAQPASVCRSTSSRWCARRSTLVSAKLPPRVTVHHSIGRPGPGGGAPPNATAGAPGGRQILRTNAVQAMPAGGNAGALKWRSSVSATAARRNHRRPRGWRVPRAYGRGYRGRHRPGDHRPHLRPLFHHHQGGRHRQPAWDFSLVHGIVTDLGGRAIDVREYPRQRHHVLLSICRGSGNAAGTQRRKGPRPCLAGDGQACARRRRRGAA